MDGSKKKYRNNLPLPEDTTMRGGPVLLTPGFLRFVGELLFGERWQTPLAHRLGEARGKMLSPATVHRWSMGSRSIPDWVGEALALILESGQRDLDHRARMVAGLATRIRNPLARDSSPSSDWAGKERSQSRQGSIH
ncbi:hypothetical protein [Methylocapsa sp. S129]|uniref:hypothetical protein n=1 Tax=Methylocapsa sp. S129 TaxID=1641869 RepID=UPI001AED51EC|nr:hypothetical protein [Methylocapsa sp. S129]